MHLGRWGKARPALTAGLACPVVVSPCPFGPSLSTHFGLLTVTTIRTWVRLLPILNSTRRSSRLGSGLPPFSPASRI